MRLHAVIACVLALACASVGAARAEPKRADLRPQPTSGPSVTLGDLFGIEGPEGGVVIANGAPFGESAVLDARVVQDLAARNGVIWDNPDRLQRILVGRRETAGPAPDREEMLTWAHSLSAGEIVRADDLAYARLPKFQSPPDAPRDAEDVIGKIARRPLRAGAAVATHDVTSPEVIHPNDTVSVTYRSGAIALTLTAKAMGAAKLGEPVDVMNPTSKKVIQAVAAGTDLAVVGPEASAIRSQSSSEDQLAALR